MLLWFRFIVFDSDILILRWVLFWFWYSDSEMTLIMILRFWFWNDSDSDSVILILMWFWFWLDSDFDSGILILVLILWLWKDWILKRFWFWFRDFDPGSDILILGWFWFWCDFGSAKMIDGPYSKAYIGTRYYRAPELLFGSRIYTQAVDISGVASWWATGCVASALFNTQPLFVLFGGLILPWFKGFMEAWSCLLKSSFDLGWFKKYFQASDGPLEDYYAEDESARRYGSTNDAAKRSPKLLNLL